MQNKRKHFTSELGILEDSQCQFLSDGKTTYIRADGYEIIAVDVDFAPNWPLEELEKDIRLGKQSAADEAEQRDFENLLQEIAAAKDDIAKSADKDAAQKLVYLGIRIGQLLARLEVRPERKTIHTGRTIRKANAEKGKKTAKLTPQQWKIIAELIRAESKRGISATKTCRRVSAELSKGQFEELLKVRITITARALQQRWTDRNK